ncbi:MAG: type IV secretory system conjugative DNA transfer family protein, partial [Anaerolineales bacterium]|nr:type IV secretory system conjugative DNA transfer family protein [Anaerolineales bacterium]
MMNEQMTIFNYWQELWREATPKTKRVLRIMVLVYGVLLLLGSYLAATQMAAIAPMKVGGKTFAAVGVGPFGVLWQLLTWLGVLVEDPRNPGLGWMLPAAVHLGFWGGVIYLGSQPVNQMALQKQQAAKHQEKQGNLSETNIIAVIPCDAGVPFVALEDEKKKPVLVGLNHDTGQGHVLVVASTRSGKGLHLTEVLKQWPGAAVVVDPKSEQWTRTAALRQQRVGPVYHLPGHQVKLAYYYNFRNPDDLQELHAQMLRPDDDNQRIFADKSLSLFRAIGHFAAARGQDALRVLLDAAEDDFLKVLRGLESVPEAKPFVRQFTNGLPPDKVTSNDRFVTSAYGTFTTRLFGYQKHIDTICPYTPKQTLPREWVARKSTLYITYSLNDLHGVGGVVSAILAGLMRDHMKKGQRQRLLVVIDETAAVRLRNLDTYLATVGGYGITMLLYAQSLSQLEGIYGKSGANAILSNCSHQLWYPPNDFQTAAHISDIFGTKLEANRSFSTVSRTFTNKEGQLQTVPQQSVSESLHETPTFLPAEVMAMPKDKVFVLTEHGQQIRFVGNRLDGRESFGQLPRPPLPPPMPVTPRRYTEWILPTAEPA